MRKIIFALKQALGFTGSAKAARIISRMEKDSLRLNSAVDEISNEIYQASLQFVEVEAKFREQQSAFEYAQSQRNSDRLRTQRVAFRLAGLVS